MAQLLKQRIIDDGFNAAVHDWLSGEVSGNLAPFMYAGDSNDQRWKNGHSSHDYYVGDDEKATFQLALKDLSLHIENFVDLGPGGHDSVMAKSLPIAEKIHASHYLPVDLSSTMALSAAQTIQQKLGIDAVPVIADFFETFPFVKPNALISLLGLTFANLETYDNARSLRQRLIDILSNYRHAVKGNSYFLVSFDANTNGEEIIACYNNDQFGALVRSCAERAIDISDFDYDVRWTPENYQLATGLRSKRDQMVAFDGDRYAIEEGEFLPILNSYRLPVKFVVEAAQQANWAHRQTWSATGRVHYVLFKAV